MCGITGFFSPSERSRGDMEAVLTAMADSMLHRGPDAGGVWADPQAGLGIGQRRLSILDLSTHGRQPMISGCGRYVIVYNGEVYNFQEIRRELEALGLSFTGDSDTEVVLEALVEWGVRKAVKRFIGMFAFALWDRRSRMLFLVRDRLGIKPLYYGWQNGSFLFGSELKSLRAHPDFQGKVDRRSLSLFFRHNYIPAPGSIYCEVGKLPPGAILTLRPEEGATTQRLEFYWSAVDVWRHAREDRRDISDELALQGLENILSDAVARRMVADVPLGAFLSGGIDSSLVVALMRAAGAGPVRTFSIGFHDARYNEAEHAAAVAAQLGTEHTELYVSPDDLLDVVPDIAHFWDEPFADASQIPMCVVSRMARQHVTVSLSGDGGDELFTGYDRYFWTRKIARLFLVPGILRKAAAWGAKCLPERVYRLLGTKGTRIRWRLDLLTVRDLKALYLFLVSHFKNPASLVLQGSDGCILDKTDLGIAATGEEGLFDQMQLWDVGTYLPDDILAKVDRASMAASLEARVPLLDHRVVEFAASLPLHMRVRNGQGKWLLRRLLYKHVPRELVDRPKKGFAVPIEQWLKHELRDWAESLLDASLIRNQGYLCADTVRRIWSEYLAGQGNWYYYLWDILMFQAWLEKEGR